MTVIDVEQGTDAWLQERAGVATASHFADILAKGRGGNEAVTRRDYKYKLAAERLTGRYIQNQYKSFEMQWGNDHEPTAAFTYTLETERKVDTIGLIKLDYMEAGASLDRTVGDKGVLEIKCPKTANHIEYLRNGELPSKYKPQVQGQLWIAEREWADFMSYDPRLPYELDHFIVRVERDEAYIQDLATEVEQFLSEVDELVNELKQLGGINARIRKQRI